MKTSVTIPAELLSAAKHAAGAGGVSALVSDALRRELDRRERLAIHDELIARNPPTKAELAEARRVLRRTTGASAARAREAIPDRLARG